MINIMLLSMTYCDTHIYDDDDDDGNGNYNDDDDD